MIPGTINAGIKMFQLRVCPRILDSQFGVRRTAPSSQPMYQSGCEPAVTCDGVYGPYSQTGLMVTSAEISTVMPNTTKKKPPAFAM